jgi:iron complex outermembrane receptor protein
MINITQGHWRKGAISFAAVTGLLASGWTTQAIAQDDDGLEEIVVTGSYIKRSQSDMASPVEIIDSKQLADIGASTLPDMINTLTINSGAQIYANHLDQGRNAGTTNINLRGLGEASTLVLLNGSRTTLTPAVNSSGDQYVNLSTLIPMIAVERVEILKDGASALYGSDAVAGVANFITRDTFEGLEFKAELSSNEHGGDETHFGAIVGGKHERGHFMAAFEYMTADPVTNAERFDEFEPTMNSITGYGAPAVNIADFGLDIRLPDPDCDLATTAFVDRQQFFDPNSNVCRMTYGYFGNIISEEERLQGYASASYEIT